MQPVAITIVCEERQCYSTKWQGRTGKRRSVCLRKSISGLILHDIFNASWGSWSIQKREWRLLFIYLHLTFFFVTQSFVPTLFSKVSYKTISLLMELIYYGESHLKMCCFTRQLSQGAMTCWLNCLPGLSELKTDISDKPSIYRSVPNGIMKNVCICMRNLWTVHVHCKLFYGIV